MAKKPESILKIDAKKYESVVLYLAEKLGGEIRGKKKLAKLLYFADFDFFEKNERPITGDVYKALPMGPFPEHMPEIIDSLSNAKFISVSLVDEIPGYRPTEVYSALKKPNLSLLSDDEKLMLDRVVRKYGHLSGKELETLTHAEAPYIGTLLNAEITYELAFYRGTDFSGHD